jgi:ribosomal protein S18 acetylase RimI-like enzyme
MTFSVRQLVPGDTETFIRLRREALDREPSAFLASPDDDRALDPAFVREAFSSTSEATFGAYVWGLYVKPTQRRNGIGRSLMVAALRFARELRGVTHVHLGVAENNVSAIGLYERLGFVSWGIEPDALRVGGALWGSRRSQPALSSTSMTST